MPLELPPPGTKVRLLVEGFVRADLFGPRLISEDRAGAGDKWPVPHWDSTQIEVLETAKPEWWPPQAGDAVLIPGPHPTVYGRESNGGWYQLGQVTRSVMADTDFAEGYLLVRDGRPYHFAA